MSAPKPSVPRRERAIKPLPSSVPPPSSIPPPPSANSATTSAAAIEPAAAGGALPSFFDDDWEDDDITVVGPLSDQVKALRQGYRQANPFASKPSSEDADIEITAEDEVDALLVEELLSDEPTGPQAMILVAGAGRTDIGRRRKGNEDAVLIMEEHQVFAVADGMGGHAGGEVASQLAVASLEGAILSGRFDGEANIFWPRRGDELARCVEMANTAIYQQASTQTGLRGMGTTMTAIRFSPNRKRAYIAHVGDSRCYRIRAGELEMLTEDHTIGNLLGAVGPLAAQLSRAVGVEADVQVDLLVEEPLEGDVYVLCSDGLNKMLKDEEIAAMASVSLDLNAMADDLIDLANARGGRDNISVILIRVVNPLRLSAADRALVMRVAVT